MGKKKSVDKIEKMKALSIAQPWAECIVSENKNIENRSWNTKFRGFFAIHASKTKDPDRFSYCAKKYKIFLTPEDVDLGYIVAIVEIKEVLTKKTLTTKNKKWFHGEYGFLLDNLIKLKKPVKIGGALGFWDLKGKPLKEVISQLTPTQLNKISNRLAKKET